MNTNAIAKQYQLKQWTQMISECRSSGIRVQDWCEQNNITKANYYYRLRRVREAMLISGEQTQIVTVPDEICIPPVNAPSNSASCGGLSISVGNATIHVESGTSKELLTMVLGVMKDVK